MAKILVLDDDKELQLLFPLILAEGKHEIKAVFTADTILTEVSLFKPDIILLDIILWGADGRDVCDLIKSYFENILIILMSANHNYLVDGLKCADEILDKPLNIRSLREMINNMVLRKSSQ